jgi:hypothetical protein
MGERLDGIHQGAIYGAAVSLSGRTPLGPMGLSIGAVDDGNWEIQFVLGRPIDEGTILDIDR